VNTPLVVKISCTEKCPFRGRWNGRGALECADWVAAIHQISDDRNLGPNAKCGNDFFGRLNYIPIGCHTVLNS
jgi:hypothetical protein